MEFDIDPFVILPASMELAELEPMLDKLMSAALSRELDEEETENVIEILFQLKDRHLYHPFSKSGREKVQTWVEKAWEEVTNPEVQDGMVTVMVMFPTPEGLAFLNSKRDVEDPELAESVKDGIETYASDGLLEGI